MNLKNSFPEKSNAELKQIEVKFYQYFFDLILETIKSLSISHQKLNQRVLLQDTSIFQKHLKKGQSVIIVMGHYGNWELGGSRFAIEPLHRLYVLYHPLQNKYFDRLTYKIRTRLGTGLYPMKDTLRAMVADRNKLTATVFIADQTPAPKGALWLDFMNQDTPVFTGVGKIAHQFNYPVIYASVKRFKRGYYKIEFEELFSNPSEVDPEKIVTQFFKKLEEDIKETPEIWLWSHRRWKHKRKK